MDEPTTREEQLFVAARDLKDLAARGAYLDAACAGEPELRAEVERLLAADRGADVFFAEGQSALSKSMAALARAEQPGDRIGRYKLLQQIGEGGCGIVYMAEQEEPVRRRVALKIVKLGMDTSSVVARFEAERQALALMDHANIARVFDAGATDSGRPYFVMELVRGVHITEYCDQHRLTTKERLELFSTVCQAVQHAHHKGIIHRDLKPSNVLVTIDDGTAVPKVIDFGIAKAIQGRLTDQTLFTAFEQLIGTPAYMSPEQALMSSVDVDTRSDIYSLGVLLYELLTGKTPFDTQALMAGGIDELRRTICEREPLRPSTRLQSLPNDELTTAAQRRRSEAPKLLSGITGDLDWIVMKCLEKDRGRRYLTANALGMDIQRHLNNEPVLARSPSATYQLGKLIRRNRGAVLAAAALLLVLCLGLVGTTLGLVQARDAALQADLAKHAATQDRDRADIARQQANLLNFRMAFDRGLALCEQGSVGSGLLWLARALELAPPNEVAMQRVIRANLTAWKRELHILKGLYASHQGAVTGAFSPDRTMVLTGGLDGVVQLWDRRTGMAYGSPLRHDAEVHTAIFSPDGAYILTTSVDKTARLWETKSGRLNQVFPHSSAVWGGLFTADGRIITSDSGGQIRVWDLKTGKALAAWEQTKQGVHDLALSPDGKQVLGAGDDGVAVVWDLLTHQQIARLAGPAVRVPTAVFVTPNRVVSGDIDGNVLLWKWQLGEGPVAGEKFDHLFQHRGGVHRIRLSPDGRQLLTASYDKRAQLLDSETGEPIGVPFEHTGALKSLAFGEDGRVLTFCEADGAREWQTAPGSLKAALQHEAQAERAIFSSDAKYMLIRTTNQGASISRTLTGETLGVPLKTGSGIHGFAISPDESKVITAASNGEVQFWETRNGSPLGEAFKHGGAAWAVAMSADGELAVSGGLNGLVKLWDARRCRPLRTVVALRNTAIRGVAFSPDGSRMAIASSDKLAWIVPTDGLEEPRKLEGHHGSVMTVAFSPDGQHLVTGSFDNTAMVWNLETGRPISKPMPHRGPFWYAVNFSTNGETVVTGCDDRTARIWDAATSKPIGPMLPHDAALRTAAFTGHDSEIITGTSSGARYVWNVSRSPLEDDVNQIKLWLEASTGLELRADGEIHPLQPEPWRKRRALLEGFTTPAH